MRIHTNTLTLNDLRDAVAAIPGGSVSLEWTRHDSRTMDHAFEVSLSGFGERHTRSKNTGRYGANDLDRAATWDDWGFFFAFLYEIDADMICGTPKHPVYANAWTYHALTWDRFNFETGTFPTEPLPALKPRELAERRHRAYRETVSA